MCKIKISVEVLQYAKVLLNRDGKGVNMMLFFITVNGVAKYVLFNNSKYLWGIKIILHKREIMNL